MKNFSSMLVKAVLLAGTFILLACPSWAALYSGAWTPTSQSVEYFNVTFTDFSPDPNFRFFIYNKDTGEELTVFNHSQFFNAATIHYTESGGNYFANLGGNILNLGTRPHFWLGFDLGAGNVYEYSYSLLAGNDQYSLSLLDKIFISSDASPVPLPASFWLLGSALAGLVGFGRRFMNI
ncbi:VPLPA-CTERM sorting domain-containing protein [Desulfonatronovibrio magnus]|uniref:VPLPA-CTERM sorting domain-containing protein n=1 Tax=Desulfonatronovibrio magnus TaxID=698827 RepID=UPI0005EBE61F|nr:VPLPA-CTERM sorting domain-containing protein [Desulfonatronovibrio magnus]